MEIIEGALDTIQVASPLYILERIKLTARVASIHAHYTRYFPANGSTNPDTF